MGKRKQWEEDLGEYLFMFGFIAFVLIGIVEFFSAIID